MRAKTEQEAFWAGDFGTAYTERNQISPRDRAPFLGRVLSLTTGVQSVCELGANRGHNLLALQWLEPSLHLTGVEVNPAACQEMGQHEDIRVVRSAIQDFRADWFDLVFTCGVLIHVAPDDLPAVYHTIDQHARRYVLLNEYFNPTPTEVTYRGHSARLFKRDFGGEFWDANPHYRLIDYGFLWKRLNPAWDDSTWWLFKRGVP